MPKGFKRFMAGFVVALLGIEPGICVASQAVKTAGSAVRAIVIAPLSANVSASIQDHTLPAADPASRAAVIALPTPMEPKMDAGSTYGLDRQRESAEKIGVELLMGEINVFLDELGLLPVMHGYLDVVALRLDYLPFRRYFREYMRHYTQDVKAPDKIGRLNW